MKILICCNILVTFVMLIGCSSYEIDKDIVKLPAELETPIVNGFRVNIYPEKKEFKLGEPIEIITILRNKSDNILKIKQYYSSLNLESYFMFELKDEAGHSSVYQPFFDLPFFVENNLHPNAMFCYINDLNKLLMFQKPGKCRLLLSLCSEIGNEGNIVSSNEIEFEVVN